MRKFIPAASVAAFALATTACGGGNSSTIEFETRADSVGYLVPDCMGDSVYAASRYSVVWPEKIGEQDFNALSDSLMALTFGAVSPSFDKAADAFLQRGLNNLAEIGDSAFTYVKVPYETAFDAERNNVQLISSNVALLTPELLVVEVITETYYYGAAHGMQTKRALNYSITKHELLTDKNMFKPGNDKAILSLITESARRRYPDEGTLFAEPITFYSNFKLTENDVVFIYQPYDIGPYSSGILEVPVSQYDLYRFLTPEAISALGL